MATCMRSHVCPLSYISRRDPVRSSAFLISFRFVSFSEPSVLFAFFFCVCVFVFRARRRIYTYINIPTYTCPSSPGTCIAVSRIPIPASATTEVTRWHPYYFPSSRRWWFSWWIPRSSWRWSVLWWAICIAQAQTNTHFNPTPEPPSS